MAVKDYYRLLEVERSASGEDIKRAYRKLAMEYHPDRNRDKPDCEERLKEINEAYQVLGYEEKRRQYDMLYNPSFNGNMRYGENLNDDLIDVLRAFSRGWTGMGGLGGCGGRGFGKRGCRRRTWNR